MDIVRKMAYKNYVLGVLTLVYTLNYLDQGLISLLLQPIKVDLRLSDSQMGFASGIAFALFYATLGVPIARWADRGNRTTITSAAIGLWGVTVMTCFCVANFSQLVLARVIAGVGEAGSMPAGYSMIGEYFPGNGERTRAMTVYMLAAPIATVISFVAGGWLNDQFGWRMTFLLLGFPGLLAAVLVKSTVVEPRVRQRRIAAHKGGTPPMVSVLVSLWQRRSTRHLGCALILLYTLGSGLSSWYAAFLSRSHFMKTSEVGAWLGIIFGVAGFVGVLAGGYVAQRWFLNNEKGQVRGTGVIVALLFPSLMLFLLLPTKGGALVSLVPVAIAFNFFFGPTFALMQRLVADDIRATTMAIFMLFANLIGMGVGPQVVGMMSDLFSPILGDEALRYSMLVMSGVALWSGYHFWQVGRSVQYDLMSIRAANGFGDAVVVP